MPVSPTFRTVDLQPLAGPLDTRSSADSLPFGAWRRRENFDVNVAGRLCRSFGWRKLMGTTTPYNNQDLHDQLCGQPTGTTNLQQYYDDLSTGAHPDADKVLTYPPSAAVCGTVLKTRSTGRQPITGLWDLTSQDGQRRLLAATQNRIYVLNEPKGNWKLICDAYGGTPQSGLPERRWQCAKLENGAVFTNNYDEPVQWIFDQPTFGCGMQAVSKIPSLQEIGLTKAAVAIAWKGVCFLMNVEMDGIRAENRIVWSDFLSTNFVPGVTTTRVNALGISETVDSMAGYMDLTRGERILAAAPLGDSLLIYTTTGIWQVSSVGGELVFSFRSLYSEPATGAACLAYPNTLVSTGNEHVFLGRDGIYVYNLSLPKPERAEWLHRCSNLIFDTINEQVCQAHVAWYDPSLERLFISWVEDGLAFPRKTFSASLRYQAVSILTAGFTAFCNFTSDNRLTFLDFLKQNCACTAAELASSEIAAILPQSVKEGGFCTAQTEPNCTGVSRSIPLYTRTTVNELGRTTTTGAFENMNLDQTVNPPASDSFCKLLGDLNIEDLCNQCNSEALLVMASADDWCLKQFGEVYFRERCTRFTGCGTYARDPYDSYGTTGPLDFEAPDDEKAVRSLELEFDAEEDITPSQVNVRIGVASTAVDPNDESGCALLWRSLSPRTLECVSKSASAHESAKTRPANTMNWAFLYTGRFHYIELQMSGVGGGSCFSRMSMEARRKPRSTRS
ncbi:MAG TPA: hypothetical protein VEH27_11850 [Methylomirabilota bacterium]|nr:hypothetical protein [Methylomirabilota bacterium]